MITHEENQRLFEIAQRLIAQARWELARKARNKK